MPHAQPAASTVTGIRAQAGPPDTRAPAPVTPGRGPRKARSPLARRAARRVAGLLRRAPKTGASYCDPLFERPDLIEDDYYRLRNQPHG